ncbi:MAG: HAMP domain-containing histidine kinase [Oscillatoriales cyanobacterium RM2_1_1]|nr:HAMP domain-containing histidine kinase [Oscillatoriales cyanobacterium SM2_3_0]NJO46749.1 HAMP domain-containing histidine kinase [Oscillatoriales cyanobacterium RM2_1_1]
MKSLSHEQQNFAIAPHLKRFRPGSLQFQLTVGIISFSTLILVGVTFWTSWRMQQLLVESHKQDIEKLSKKITDEVGIYREMMSDMEAIEKSINKPESRDSLIWVRKDNGELFAQSESFRDRVDPELKVELLNHTKMPLKPQVARLGEQYWVLCGETFNLPGKPIGKLYLVSDITKEYQVFLSLFHSLLPATILALLMLVVAIAWYVRRSLQPLQEIGQLAENISADQLSDYRIQIEKAPDEVAMLADTCNKMLDRLAESFEQQRQFVSNVSHELRTPLTIVRGYLQSTLKRGDNLSPMQREGLEVASNEADRTIQLLQDLLALARADHGSLHFQIESISVNHLVTEVTEMAKPFGQGRVKAEPMQSDIWVLADCDRLKQVLLNLIDNALKYSQPEKPVTLKVKHKGKQALISIIDQGCGIPLQHQARIFERFYRVNEARNRAGGTGLGLSIVKTLVEGMGGRVTVRSQVNQGSIFTIFLPAVTSIQAEPQSLMATNTGPSPRL